MSLSHQTLSQEDLNLLRNDLIKFDCGPLVYQTIIEWGFEKPEGVKIIEHLKDQKIEENCGRNLKNWLKKNNDALQKEDFSSFDVTTLHDLLPVLCYDKVNQTGGTEYEAKLKDTTSIEYLLKEIKNFRNDVSHEYSKSTEDPKIEDKKQLMQNCIRTAGTLYNKDQSEIDAKVANLDAKFANIMQKTSSSYEYAVQHVTNKIERECPTFMLEKYSSLFSVPLPAGLGKIDSTEIFESVNMSVTVKDEDKTKMVEDPEDKYETKLVDQTVKDKDETKMVDQTLKDKDETKMVDQTLKDKDETNMVDQTLKDKDETNMVDQTLKDKDETKMVDQTLKDKDETKMVDQTLTDKDETKMVDQTLKDKDKTEMVDQTLKDKDKTEMVDQTLKDKDETKMVDQTLKDKDETKMVDQTLKDKDETKMVDQTLKDKDETKMVDQTLKDKDETKMVDQSLKDKDETNLVDQTVKDKDETEMVKDDTVANKDETKRQKNATGDSKMNKIVFKSSEICNHVSNKFVVINGGPGSGKTTLTRHIFQNILKNAVNGSETSYEGIEKFRVPIYLECRTERQNNLRDFLKETFRNLNLSKEVIYEAFKHVTGQVFIIDGYDEVNDKSRKLVKDAIEFCSKFNATCIVSGRDDAGNNFIGILNDQRLSYNEMHIEPISEMSDKVSLLRRYGDKMSDVNSNELVKSFENLNDSAQKVFFCPVLLALFISLFVNHRDSLSQLHNEQSAYKAIREMFCEEIEKKLKENNIANPELRAKWLLEVFSDHSLRLFSIKKYFFDKEEFLSLSNDCLQKISNYDVDIKWVFSCILTPDTSFRSEKTLTYAFTHSSIQEYLAVGHMYKNMRESKIDWNSEECSEDSLRSQFLNCLGASTSLSDGSTSDGSTSDESTSDESTSDGSDSEDKFTVFDEETLSGVRKKVNRYGNIIKLLILETSENGKLKSFTRTFTAVLREYFVPEGAVPPDYLYDLVASSNCDSAIVSIVSNALGDEDGYLIRYTRHIRPLNELLKMRQTDVTVGLEFSESLTDSDCVNLGKLMSVLKGGSRIMLYFKHSFLNFQPLNGEFYSQLKNSRCEVSKFYACVESSEHLSIVRSVMRDDDDDNLAISTVSVCDVSFATLEGHKGEIDVIVKYTDDCPNTGSNPVTENTVLTIDKIPADGKDYVYKMIKFLCPKSKQFRRIDLDKCHLTDTDASELLKKLKGEKIRTEEGERTEVEKRSVNKDKSRDLMLYLPDFGWREAAQQEAEQREAEQREAAQLEAAKREAEQQEAAKREAEQREAEQREAEQREAEQREAAKREAEQREAAKREAEQREAEQQKNEIKNKSKLRIFRNFFRRF